MSHHTDSVFAAFPIVEFVVIVTDLICHHCPLCIINHLVCLCIQVPVFSVHICLVLFVNGCACFLFLDLPLPCG